MLLFSLENSHISTVRNTECPGSFADHVRQNLVSDRKQMEVFLLLKQHIPHLLSIMRKLFPLSSHIQLRIVEKQIPQQCLPQLIFHVFATAGQNRLPCPDRIKI